ncbi:RING-H2 finger protein ATL5-like [Argentina anserina]|uniref:RING-H2 finger protein ATL5-like n=1 Tax=Argentina anserina TaxID=57926 RepID=UPI00217635D1|nr:RING-H2 finger protein ATL5-like [Potentilla anserina]
MIHDQAPAKYALNGKIMLCSVIILFPVIFVVLCFHSYVRLCFSREQPLRRRRRRRQRRVFSHNNIIPPAVGFSSNVSQKGLDFSILKTLPSFFYDVSTHELEQLDCPVCLSEFEDGERGRVLPNCKHAFHIECIDTWFKSNTNCPLCRCHVRQDTPHEVVITVSGEPASSRSDEEGEDKMGSPSTRFPVEECGRRPLDLVGMATDDRVRNFGWAKSHGVKCSGDQTASLKRIWSI